MKTIILLATICAASVLMTTGCATSCCKDKDASCKPAAAACNGSCCKDPDTCKKCCGDEAGCKKCCEKS